MQMLKCVFQFCEGSPFCYYCMPLQFETKVITAWLFITYNLNVQYFFCSNQCLCRQQCSRSQTHHKADFNQQFFQTNKSNDQTMLKIIKIIWWNTYFNENQSTPPFDKKDFRPILPSPSWDLRQKHIRRKTFSNKKNSTKKIFVKTAIRRLVLFRQKIRPDHIRRAVIVPSLCMLYVMFLEPLSKNIGSM